MVTHEQAAEKVRLGFLIHAGVSVAVAAPLMMNFLRHPEKLWSLWMAGGWGLGLALHGAGVFLNPHVRERMIERTRDRL